MPETPNNPAPAAKSGFDSFVQKLATVMLREPPDLQNRVNELRELYPPNNIQETVYLNQLASAQIDMERLGRLQSGIFSLCMEQGMELGFNFSNEFPEVLQADTDLNAEQRMNFSFAKGFVEMLRKGNALALFNRLYTQAERRLRHAQETLDRIRRQKLQAPAPQQPLAESKPQAPKQSTQSPQSAPAKKQPSSSQGPKRLPDIRSRPG